MNQKIEVKTDVKRVYEFNLGRGLQEIPRFIKEYFECDTIFAAIDEQVYHLHKQRIDTALEDTGKTIHIYKIPQGETSKGVTEYNRLCNFLLNNKVRRTTPLLAIGGGVTGDLAGFAAATVLRGIPLIHLPTSLLAMVDSSIGGKTGINHETGKNLLGSFYQPKIIYADLNFLTTLPEEEWINGMSEILKYAAIKNPAMFDQIQQAVEIDGFKPADNWGTLILNSAKIKIDIVEQDVEESGIRAYLNFGHTFAHALEKISRYGTISHGEAVYIGMLAALYYGQNIGDKVTMEPVERFLAYYKYKLSPLSYDKNQVAALLKAMKYDKKIKKHKIRLVLLKKFGKPYLHTVTNEQRVDEAWRYAFSKFD